MSVFHFNISKLSCVLHAGMQRFLKKDFYIKSRTILYIEINIFWAVMILVIKAMEVMHLWDKCNLNPHMSTIQW